MRNGTRQPEDRADTNNGQQRERQGGARVGWLYENRRLAGWFDWCRALRGVVLHLLYRRNKPVPAAGQSFDVARCVGGIAENFTKARDCVVKAMVEIDEGVGCPELASQFLAGYKMARSLEQYRKELYGLAVQTQFDTAFTQFSSMLIQFKRVEPQHAPHRSRCGRTDPPRLERLSQVLLRGEDSGRNS